MATNGDPDVVENDFNSEKDGNCFAIANGNQDQGDALGHRPCFGGEVFARMPTERFASHYNMNHKSRGIALIFNHEFFDVGNLKPRAGTEQDLKNLKAVLKGLGFEVRDFQDLKYKDIERHIKEVAETEHTHYDCLLVAVLSHGDTGVLYAKDTPYKPEHLWTKFTADRCPSLAGKPKIFFLQACQGDKLDGGVVISRTETDGQQQVNAYRIPTQADFLVVYSTVKGYYSWRNTTKGSWFIQALCDELRHRAYNTDLMTILTFVAQRVAFDFESNCPDAPSMHQQKQIPCVMSMLTRLIQFTPVKGSEEQIETDEKYEKSKSILKGMFQRSRDAFRMN